jgi:hypothetical protein
MGQTGTIRDVFDIGERLCIGVGDSWAMVLLAEGDNVFGRKVVIIDLLWRCLGYVVILAVQTVEVTTRTGQRETCGAWMKMIKRFLLYRIDGQGTGLAIDLADELAAVIPSTAADTRLAVGNTTVVRTELTLYLSILQ